MTRFDHCFDEGDLFDDSHEAENPDSANALDKYAEMLGEYCPDFLVEYRPLDEIRLSDADYDLSRLQWEARDSDGGIVSQFIGTG